MDHENTIELNTTEAIFLANTVELHNLPFTKVDLYNTGHVVSMTGILCGKKEKTYIIRIYVSDINEIFTFKTLKKSLYKRYNDFLFNSLMVWRATTEGMREEWLRDIYFAKIGHIIAVRKRKISKTTNTK